MLKQYTDPTAYVPRERDDLDKVSFPEIKAYTQHLIDDYKMLQRHQFLGILQETFFISIKDLFQKARDSKKEFMKFFFTTDGIYNANFNNIIGYPTNLQELNSATNDIPVLFQYTDPPTNPTAPAPSQYTFFTRQYIIDKNDSNPQGIKTKLHFDKNHIKKIHFERFFPDLT